MMPKDQPAPRLATFSRSPDKLDLCANPSESSTAKQERDLFEKRKILLLRGDWVSVGMQKPIPVKFDTEDRRWSKSQESTSRRIRHLGPKYDHSEEHSRDYPAASEHFRSARLRGQSIPLRPSTNAPTPPGSQAPSRRGIILRHSSRTSSSEGSRETKRRRHKKERNCLLLPPSSPVGVLHPIPQRPVPCSLLTVKLFGSDDFDSNRAKVSQPKSLPSSLNYGDDENWRERAALSGSHSPSQHGLHGKNTPRRMRFSPGVSELKQDVSVRKGWAFNVSGFPLSTPHPPAPLMNPYQSSKSPLRDETTRTASPVGSCLNDNVLNKDSTTFFAHSRLDMETMESEKLRKGVLETTGGKANVIPSLASSGSQGDLLCGISDVATADVDTRDLMDCCNRRFSSSVTHINKETSFSPLSLTSLTKLGHSSTHLDTEPSISEPRQGELCKQGSCAPYHEGRQLFSDQASFAVQAPEYQTGEMASAEYFKFAQPKRFVGKLSSTMEKQPALAVSPVTMVKKRDDEGDQGNGVGTVEPVLETYRNIVVTLSKNLKKNTGSLKSQSLRFLEPWRPNDEEQWHFLTSESKVKDERLSGLTSGSNMAHCENFWGLGPCWYPTAAVFQARVNLAVRFAPFSLFPSIVST
ncbi:hypothetical protein VTK73DRAFT_737 [Phialemonium thermophilum]|uniref:Uncharacterized protein n=1 Tax=Phialemonium thermophilum TaxID=223376 RepID=A0ABR3XDS1_9PEZI